MRISKLLNKKYFSILIILFSVNSYADEKPVDIWNIEKKDPKKNL